MQLFMRVCLEEIPNESKNTQTHLEDLKASDVQDAYEGGALPLPAVQSSVYPVDQPSEQTLVCSLGQGLHRKVCLETETRTTVR